MKKIICITFLILTGISGHRLHAAEASNLDEAKQLSVQLNKPILLEFVRED